MKVSDYMVLQGIAYATDIGKRGSMPYRPLVSLPSVGEQFDKFFGGGALGVNVVERAPANNHEARRPASTHPQRKDAQPSRAVSQDPATIQHAGVSPAGDLM